MSESSLEFEGGCFCGAVRYRATADPGNVSSCHCGDCRRCSAAPYVPWVCGVRSADFAFTRGEPQVYSYEGRSRTFCGRCGTPLTFWVHDAPEELDVTVCSADEPERLAPRDHLWTSDCLPWVQIADGLPTFETRRDA